MRRIISVLLAGMIGCSIFNVSGLNVAVSAYTETEKSDILTGNSDEDRKTNIADILLLQRWFLGDEDVLITDTKPLDLNKNGRADIADFCYIKNLLLDEKVSLTEKELIPPAVKALDPDLPSVGTDRIPVFAVSFPDCEFKYDDTTDRLQKTIFSPEDKDDPLYPMESVTAYYDRSSYGRLHLEGDVFEYSAEHPIDWYLKSSARSLVSEILEAFDDDLDYNNYDADDDKKIDSMILIFPDEAIEYDDNEDGSPDCWPYSTSVIDKEKYDGVTAGSFCVISYIDNDRAEFNTRIAHELGHAMGLEDYYEATDNIMTDNEGMPGPAGIELMDEGTGDLSACSKLLLGWFAEDEVQIYTGGTEEFTLTSTQGSPSCIVIPKTPSDLYLGEYFIIEYIRGLPSVCGRFLKSILKHPFNNS